MIRKFIATVLPGIIKPMRILWNEVIGFVFLCFAVIPIPRLVKSWREFGESGEGLFRVLLAVFFILLMGGFGISSFLRARKLSRS